MPAKTSPDPKNTSVNNTAEATTNTDRRAFMAGAAGAGAALAGLAATSPAHAADMAVPKDMKGKTAFVTGAARGIGLSCADALAARGANIVILDVASRLQMCLILQPQPLIWLRPRRKSNHMAYHVLLWQVMSVIWMRK